MREPERGRRSLWLGPLFLLIAMFGVVAAFPGNTREHSNSLIALILAFPFGWWATRVLTQKWASRRRRDYSREGICYKCGYDLKGSTAYRCPECGTINGRGDLIRDGE